MSHLSLDIYKRLLRWNTSFLLLKMIGYCRVRNFDSCLFSHCPWYLCGMNIAPKVSLIYKYQWGQWVCQESRSTNLIKLAKVSDLTILHNLIKRREDLAQDFSLNQVSLSPCLKSVENLFFLDCFDTSKGFYSICCLCPDCSLFSLWFICSQFILSPTSLRGSFSSKWLSWGGGWITVW